MPASIVLSVNAVNRTLSLVRSDGETEIFEEKVGPLIGRLRLTSISKDNTAKTVTRTRLKLERAQVDVTVAAPGIAAATKVRYLEVWSHDITVVKSGEAAGRTEMYDFSKALVAHAAVKGMVVDGTNLSA